MDEVEAATASIAQPNSEEDTDNILNPVTLEDSAEQILNGIKREVEVQYLVPMMVANNDHVANQQNQQIVQQTEFQCPFKESGERIITLCISGNYWERLIHIYETKLTKWLADFLNPVSKEVVAEECGLVSEGYLVTDLNPNAFGLNVIDPEIIGSENLFGEELSFQFYELTSPSQLQSAWHTESNKIHFIVIDELQIQNMRALDDDDRPVCSIAETEGNISESENSQRRSPVNSDQDECATTSWSYSNCAKFLR